MDTKSSKRPLILSMLIFGTIGIFRNYIPLSSNMLAMLRGFIGTAFLLLLVKSKGKSLGWPSIRANLKYLVFSGIMIGLNWIALFEAYRYTSVAVATLCYYMAPVIVILSSPLLLREKLTLPKFLCAAAAFAGMVFVSGILSQDPPGADERIGIVLGLVAACLYSGAILLNKKMGEVDAYDKTIVQLGTAALILLPYNLVSPDRGSLLSMNLTTGLLVLVVGIVHTGIAYALYFSSIKGLKAQTVALYSYIDPIAAILLSVIIFRENMGLHGFIGAVLVLGSTLISDLLDRE